MSTFEETEERDRIGEILERLARVEQIVAGQTPRRHYNFNSDLCQRFGGKSDMTLRRWHADPQMNFPQPDVVIRGRPAWTDETIEKWERERIARAT